MKCRWCGKQLKDNIQSLRIHLRWCKERPKTVVTSIRWPKDERNAFRRIMRVHGLTECQGLRTIAQAIILATSNGCAVTIDARPEADRLRIFHGRNPLVVHIEKLQPTYIGFPRRPKVPVELTFKPTPKLEQKEEGVICMLCKHLGNWDFEKRYRICEKYNKPIRYPLSRRKCNDFECIGAGSS